MLSTNYGLERPSRANKIKPTIDTLGLTVESIDNLIKARENEIQNNIQTTAANTTAITSLFQSVSNGKTDLETAITGKGGTVSKVDSIPTFSELESAINTLPASGGDTSILKTKLSVAAGYQFNVDLGVGKTVMDANLTLIEHVPGAVVNKLALTMDNGDLSSFVTNPNLDSVNGKMVIKTFSATKALTLLEQGVYVSDSFNFNDGVQYNVPTVNTSDVSFTYGASHVIAVPTSFVDLSNIDSLADIILATVGEIPTDGILGYAIDFGSGPKVWDGSSWVNIALTEAALSLGANAPITLNNMTSATLELGRNGSNQIKIIYFIKRTNVSSLIGNDSITLKVNLAATPEFAASSKYTLSMVGTVVRCTINAEGAYTFKYTQ